MIGSKVNKDITPYVLAAREPIAYCGVNSVGLRRRGFTNEQINNIQDIYRILYMSDLNVSQAIEKIATEIKASPEKDEIVTFVTSSTRGICRRDKK